MQEDFYQNSKEMKLYITSGQLDAVKYKPTTIVTSGLIHLLAQFCIYNANCPSEKNRPLHNNCHYYIHLNFDRPKYELTIDSTM